MPAGKQNPFKFVYIYIYTYTYMLSGPGSSGLPSPPPPPPNTPYGTPSLSFDGTGEEDDDGNDVVEHDVKDDLIVV